MVEITKHQLKNSKLCRPSGVSISIEPWYLVFLSSLNGMASHTSTTLFTSYSVTEISSMICQRYVIVVLHLIFDYYVPTPWNLQQVFYAALIYLTHTTSPEGYWLVRMLRSYLQLDSLIGLNIHTESTLAMIEEELLVFNKELKVLYFYCTCHS